jgi:hypothetical protein
MVERLEREASALERSSKEAHLVAMITKREAGALAIFLREVAATLRLANEHVGVKRDE